MILNRAIARTFIAALLVLLGTRTVAAETKPLPEGRSDAPFSEARLALATRCTSALTDKLTPSGLSPGTVARTCTCASEKIKWDSRIEAMAADLGRDVPEQSEDLRYAATSILSSLVACVADELQEDASQVDTAKLNFPDFVKALTSNKAGSKRSLLVRSASAKLSDCKRPDYPKQIAAMGIEGATTVGLFVDATGKEQKVRIDQSSGDTPWHKYLDFLAASYLATCPFEPALDSKGPTESWTAVKYEWKLE